VTEAAAALVWLALAVPLALAFVAPLLARPLRLLPWAAGPGLAAALFAPRGEMVEIPPLVLGLSLELDAIGAVFLGFGAGLWLLAGAYARTYLAETQRARGFTTFWLLTQAGTLGTFIAADVVTFYLSFSLMTLAGFGLVVHDRTAAARRAAGVYIVVAVIGETALLAALMLAATGADSTQIAVVSASLAASPDSGPVIAGMVIGLGVKAGLVPLHVWLPLAHPEAPTPASAVLSGVIVKAGIIGFMRFLPMGDAAGHWGAALVIAGLVTAYYGVLVGVLQDKTKAILAYSTLSQLGLVVAVLGHGMGRIAGEDGGAVGGSIAAATLYAAHHGLAKGALFLAVGVVAASQRRAFLPVMAVTAGIALAVAGLPLSGGALAKLAIKEPLGDGLTATLVTLSAVGTALLMLRFLVVLGRGWTAPPPTAGPALGLFIPWSLVVVAAIAVPWMLFPELAGGSPATVLTPASIWAGLWPLLAAVGVALVVRRRWSRPPLTVPTGDLVVVAEAGIRGVRGAIGRLPAAVTGAASFGRPAAAAQSFAVDEVIEALLRRWGIAGPALVVVAGLIAVALGP
jgi:formate hydrogenlyase subunit 3/multisubunit Na+/H+ antiporter MnhD subunit